MRFAFAGPLYSLACNNFIVQDFLAKILSLDVWSVISPYRSSVAGIVSFTVLHMLTVAVLFEPSLPCWNCAWTVSAKVCMVATAACLPFGYFTVTGFALAAWLCLYAIAPRARPINPHPAGLGAVA